VTVSGSSRWTAGAGSTSDREHGLIVELHSRERHKCSRQHSLNLGRCRVHRDVRGPRTTAHSDLPERARLHLCRSRECSSTIRPCSRSLVLPAPAVHRELPDTVTMPSADAISKSFESKAGIAIWSLNLPGFCCCMCVMTRK